MSGIRFTPANKHDSFQEHCNVCKYPDQTPAIYAMEIGVDSNVVRREMLCLEHLRELIGLSFEALLEAPREKHEDTDAVSDNPATKQTLFKGEL